MDTPHPTTVRLAADVHGLLKRAAELQGRTLTDFVVTAARDSHQPDLEAGHDNHLPLTEWNLSGAKDPVRPVHQAGSRLGDRARTAGAGRSSASKSYTEFHKVHTEFHGENYANPYTTADRCEAARSANK